MTFKNVEANDFLKAHNGGMEFLEISLKDMKNIKAS